MTIGGIPLHPLVVHAAVVFTPLAAFAMIAQVVPNWRWAARWAALISSVIAAVSVQISAMTGENLLEKLNEHSAILEAHEEWAEKLQIGSWALAVLAVIAFVVLPVKARLAGATDRPGKGGPVLEKAVLALVVLLALVEIYLVFMTGHAGAQSVWKG